MNGFGSLAFVSVLLQLSVPSYALRLVRRFGAQRVGWFLVAAFSSLALLHCFKSAIGSAGIGMDLLYVSISFLLLVGMGHLDTLWSCRRACAERRAASGRAQEETAASPVEAVGGAETLPEPTRPVRAPFDALELAARENLKRDAMRQLAGWTGQLVDNAVTTIRGQADSLRHRQQDTVIRQQLEQISTAALRASRLTRQLLLVGGQYRLQRELINLNDTLQTHYWKLKRLLGDGVELRQFLHPNLPLVIGDARLLDHIAVNLVVLLGGSMGDNGTVTISTRPVRIGREHARRTRGGRTGNFVCLEFAGGGDLISRLLTSGEPKMPPDVALRWGSIEAAVEQLFGWTELSANASVGNEVRIYLPAVRAARKRGPAQ